MLVNKDFNCCDCGSTNLMFQAWVNQNKKREFVVDEIIDIGFANCLDCNLEVKVNMLDIQEIK